MEWVPEGPLSVLQEDKMMEMLGVKRFHFLSDDGAYSYVWVGTWNGERVVIKLSGDPSYLRVVRRAMEYPSPCFARIYKAIPCPKEFKVENSYGEISRCITIEEALNQLSNRDFALLERICWRMVSTPFTPKAVAKTLHRVKTRGDESKDLIRPLENQVLPMTQALTERGIYWWDFHEQNILRRGRQWVICDLGRCRMMPEFPVRRKTDGVGK